jgi:C4-dicarboxylate-specific signal transduction histidine kinase
MFRDIERIRHIINHVRTFSRDQEKEKPERVDVGRVIRNAVSLVDQQYRNHNIALVLELPPEPLCVSGNPFRLEQVLLNLMSNAKYAVESKARSSREDAYVKEIKLRAYRNASRVCIEVNDNGTGIAKDHIDRIFDPFFTTKEKESGTGLGLSIVYGIVKDSDGDIAVESDPGHYTLFMIHLPVLEDE